MRLAVIVLLMLASVATAADPRMLAAAYEIAGRVTASGEPWTPADFGDDLGMWLRSESATMSVITNEVDRWTNTAPAAASVAVATASTRRPDLIASALNGKAIVRWNGSVDRATYSGTNDLRAVPGYSAIYVFRPNAIPTGAQNLVTYYTAANGTTRFFFSLDSNKRLGYGVRRDDGDGTVSGFSPTNQAAISTSQWCIASLSIDFATRGVTIYANGTALTNAANATSEGALSSDTASAAVPIVNVGATYFNGDTAEIIVLKKGATLSDIQKAEGYAAERYDLRALLPADHPYKAAAPTK